MVASPASWSVDEVATWARSAKLSDATVTSLIENEVDGPTLTTLRKGELQSELGIASLAARRYLWDLIEKIRSEQVTADYAAAVDVHKEEILALSKLSTTPDEASGGTQSVDATTLRDMWNDAERQRQIVEDHMLAHQLWRECNVGQQAYEDADLARTEQLRLNQLKVQSDYDREFALSLSGRGTGRAKFNISEPVKNLFKTAAFDRSDVEKALQSGQIQSIDKWIKSGPTDNSDSKGSNNLANSQPLIETCHVCYDNAVNGFTLACDHLQCCDCMKKFLKAAIKDSSLLPLTCCEIPIDISTVACVLKQEEAELLRIRTIEVLAKKKMHCPSCNNFINLDEISKSVKNIVCDCGQDICPQCKTEAHPYWSCSDIQAAREVDDQAIFELAKKNGWKQCPECKTMIEFTSGCNHMHCTNCRHDFCFKCLRKWNTNSGLCSSGRCERWDEDRLLEAGERRVQVEEAARGEMLPVEARRIRLQDVMQALRDNEVCRHEWLRTSLTGECERCGFDLWVYGMVCIQTCSATVCYTCAQHRIPRRGWR